MNVFKRFMRRLKIGSPVVARYDAAYSSPNRTYIPAVVASAREDINSFSRLEILRKVRYFEKNSPIVQKLLDLIETNVVGTGINPTPNSSVEKWNAESLERWNQWCTVCDVTSRQHFYTLQAIIARAVAVDGEIFVYLTQGDNGRPRIQLIESHRVVDAEARQFIAEGYTLVDGILIDQRGRPAFYLVADDFPITGQPSRVTAIPADQIVHVFEPSRAGQYRGISIFHSVINTLHDLDDLQRFEMLAAKDAAATSKVVKTKSGEATKKDLFAGQTNVLGERTAYYRRMLGGEAIVIDRDDEYAQFASERPTVTTQAFWEYLTDLVCKGVGISFAAFQDYRGQWGGAALRGAVVSDNRFFEIRTRTLTSSCDRIWRHAIGSDIASNAIATPAPRDWTKVSWQPPRRASVDIGRESKALLEEMRVGVRTFRDVLGESGLDWRENIRQRMIEQKYILDTAKELKIPAGMVLSMVGAANNTNVFGEKAAEAIDGEKKEEVSPEQKREAPDA